MSRYRNSAEFEDSPDSRRIVAILGSKNCYFPWTTKKRLEVLILPFLWIFTLHCDLTNWSHSMRCQGLSSPQKFCKLTRVTGAQGSPYVQGMLLKWWPSCFFPRSSPLLFISFGHCSPRRSFPISKLGTCSSCQECSRGWPSCGWLPSIMPIWADMPSFPRGLPWSSSMGNHPQRAKSLETRSPFKYLETPTHFFYPLSSIPPEVWLWEASLCHP